MRGQVKWGIGLIVVGLGLLIVIDHTLVRLLYGLPLIVIGMALIHYKSREEVIEEIRE